MPLSEQLEDILHPLLVTAPGALGVAPARRGGAPSACAPARGRVELRESRPAYAPLCAAAPPAPRGATLSPAPVRLDAPHRDVDALALRRRATRAWCRSCRHRARTEEDLSGSRSCALPRPAPVAAGRPDRRRLFASPSPATIKRDGRIISSSTAILHPFEREVRSSTSTRVPEHRETTSVCSSTSWPHQVRRQAAKASDARNLVVRRPPREMWGSRPLPEVVTRSTGTGRVLGGSGAAGARRPRLDGLSQRRAQGSEVRGCRRGRVVRSRGCRRGSPPEEIRSTERLADEAEPARRSPTETRLPLALAGKASRANPATSAGTRGPARARRAATGTGRV